MARRDCKRCVIVSVSHWITQHTVLDKTYCYVIYWLRGSEQTTEKWFVLYNKNQNQKWNQTIKVLGKFSGNGQIRQQQSFDAFMLHTKQTTSLVCHLVQRAGCFAKIKPEFAQIGLQSMIIPIETRLLYKYLWLFHFLIVWNRGLR